MSAVRLEKGEAVRIGFLPLVDSAILIAAQECGFAAAEGVAIELVRDVSWSNIRDRVVHGRLHAAHMLAGLPIAVSLGLGQPATPLIAPFNLGLNGNAITLSLAIAGALGPERLADPAASAEALARVVRQRQADGASPLRLGIVHPFSSHNYMLRYWLAYAGLMPDRDVGLVVVPPPYMVDALRSGEVDGFCVGEPWSSVAVAEGVARIVALGCRIWQRGVEKVLGCRADWAEANPDALAALIRALDRAASWTGDAAHHADLAAMLAQPRYLDKPAELIRRALDGRLTVAPAAPPIAAEDFLLFYKDAANFPWVSQALWIYSQMVRWGQVAPSDAAEAEVRRVFRPDLYRRALGDSATPLPGANAKVEGSLDISLPVGSPRGRLSIGPDRFFDNRVFDPVDIAGYLRSFATHPSR
ncbi:CmpA/NrtA family ABC transporter substrate-binding protein [Pedomonas mirosovicensis]|uniref:CmpA/NrtA family ABC transporter substrate-binding protein n=1 Tax=Pedomonas mirosovicensis TaxID=2908641 RepID=UPI002168E8F3|nr:CmpA/NrtA family ABC transporter substrate-binding protein [Pedomonas mirosovicensis]MCH8686639.1 ABC transporter substrate-binding protein [Pedomonas mirosovicensis]